MAKTQIDPTSVLVEFVHHWNDLNSDGTLANCYKPGDQLKVPVRLGEALIEDGVAKSADEPASEGTTAP